MTKIALPPLKYVGAAVLQWLGVGLLLGLTVLLTYFPMGFLVIWTAKHTKNAYNESETVHSQKYIDLGSSGHWQYWASAVKFIRRWNNYEDGLRGEPSGKHSASCGGKEATFWNQYSWLCRNSYNEGKRTSRFFACFVNDCVIEWWGTGDVSDKAPIKDGWYFIRATDTTSGRVYYGYRYVVANERNVGVRAFIVKTMIGLGNLIARITGGKKRVMDGTVYNAVLGYKIKPSHANDKQDADDLDKAFTARIQFASTPD